MTALSWLIPIALVLGLIGLVAFLWALRSGQFDDLDGAAYRILEDDREEPEPPAKSAKPAAATAADKTASPPQNDGTPTSRGA